MSNKMEEIFYTYIKWKADLLKYEQYEFKGKNIYSPEKIQTLSWRR